MGAWRVLLATTLRPPSRTCKSINTMRRMEDMRMMRFIDKIKNPESVVKSPFFAIVFFAFGLILWQYVLMNRYFSLFWVFFLGKVYAQGSFLSGSGEIDTPSYMFDVGKIFPSPREMPGDQGIDNVIEYIIAMIPLLTTLMAVGAVLMVIL